jgi:hypothetical protein
MLGIEKLAEYSKLSGEKALAEYAYEDAVSHFQQALTAKEGQPADVDMADILFGLGRAQVSTLMLAQAQVAMDNLTRAFDYYVEAGMPDKAIAVAQGRPRLHTADRNRRVTLSCPGVRPLRLTGSWQNPP